MADEKYYEQKLTNALIDYLSTLQKAMKFIKAVDLRTRIIGTISAKLERKLGIDGSEAKTYINYATGQFKPGKWMPHCLDPELKNLFAQLETVTKEVHIYPWRLSSEADEDTAAKKSQLLKAVEENKRVFGEVKAKEIASRAKAAAIKATGINF